MIRNEPFLSLRKARHIMQQAFHWYKRKGKTLPPNEHAAFESDLKQLDRALLASDRGAADPYARKIEAFCTTHFKKSFLDVCKELLIALVLALLIATLVRQMWFENYEIPTGSMRPTFMEQDHLTVSKAAFGLNVPLETKHFYFDPHLVQRTSAFIFSADGMAVPDVDTTYFWILPYKKRLIKRMIGKPGDAFYFYGGKLYGVDSEGNDLTEFFTAPWMEKLEYIPFITFEGAVKVAPGSNQAVFHQMNLPVGRLTFSPLGEMTGEIHTDKGWIKSKPGAHSQTSISHYSDFLGMRNFGMARLLTKKELQNYSSADHQGLEDAKLYLEIRHNPSLIYPKPTLQREKGGSRLMLTPYVSVIPLKERHLQAIHENIYTARFIVKDGRARNYSVEYTQPASLNPRFSGVPDGTYEFYYGKGYRVGWGAITYELSESHPLNERDPANIQRLFNLGIQVNTHYEPHSKDQNTFPSRYVYFRNGDLYMLGGAIFKEDDPILQTFVRQEENKARQAAATKPYVPFKDWGAPVKDGKFNAEFIRAFGINIPEKGYLALGDNHAMSGDSRSFGMVPEANIQGAPCEILWPPGSRWGAPSQKPYPFMTLPRLIVWCIALLILGIWYVIHRINLRKPYFPSVEKSNNEIHGQKTL